MRQSAIYEGSVTHRRWFPRSHRFTYGVYYLWLDLDELATLDRTVRGFGHNRFAPFAFHDRDHGPRDGSPLRPWFDGVIAGAGVDLKGGSVRLLTMPRIWGYVFNPISVWCGYGPDGDLRVVMYEVSNTFGHDHCYVCPVRERDARGTVRHTFDKELFVSPFIDMEAAYEFILRPPRERLTLRVREDVPSGRVLTAALVGQRRALDAASLWRVSATHPMLTLKVIGGIHLEALRLWRKGAPFRRHGPAPNRSVTIVSTRDAARVA